LPLALGDLLLIAALIVAFGIITCGRAFTDALIWIIKSTVGKVPLLRGIFAKPAEAGLQKLSHTLGTFANSIGADISRNWHYLATIVDRVGWTMFHLGLAIERLYTYVTLGYPLHLLWATAKDAYRLASRAGHAVGNTTFVTKVIRQTITLPARSPLAPAVRAITKPLTAELHRFEAWARHAIAITSAGAVGVPARVGFTWKQLRAIKARLRKLERLLTVGGAVALVTMAFGRMGLGWLRCPSLSRAGRLVGCGGFAALEELLSPLVEALVVVDLCRFALASQRLAREVVPALGAVILAADAICLGGGASLPSAADATTVSGHIRLPSASD
jgi:hypothetical protein